MRQHQDEIRAALDEGLGFTSNNGDIVVTVHEDELPGSDDPSRLTIRVPVVVSFTTDPREMDDRDGETPPTKRSLVEYLSESAFRLDIDTEGYGQPEGAVFAAAGVEWDRAELIKG